MRKVMRSIHEGARDLTRALSQEDEWIVSRRERGQTRSTKSNAALGLRQNSAAINR